MRISDWSSDVCSSDLLDNAADEDLSQRVRRHRHHHAPAEESEADEDGELAPDGIGDRAEEQLAEHHAEDEESDDELRILGLGDGQGGADVAPRRQHGVDAERRSEEHTSELQSLMRISYAVFCLKK